MPKLPGETQDGPYDKEIWYHMMLNFPCSWKYLRCIETLNQTFYTQPIGLQNLLFAFTNALTAVNCLGQNLAEK